MPPARRRRPWRTAFFVFVGFCALVLAAPHAIAIDGVRQNIEDELSQALGVPCRIGRLGFSWFSGVAVVGLEIGNPPDFPADHPCLRLRRAAGDVGLLALFDGRFSFRGTVDDLCVYVDQRDDGTTNLEALFGGSVSVSTRGSRRDGDRGAGDLDLGRLHLDVQVRQSLVEIRREGELLEALNEVTCRIAKGYGSQNVTVDLQARLTPTTAGAPPGRLELKVDADVAAGTTAAQMTTMGLDLQRYGPLVDTVVPGQVTALAGIANGTLGLRLHGSATAALLGDLTIVGPRLAGPLVSGMDLRGERWTLRPELSIGQRASNRRPLDNRRFQVDLGWLRITGVDAASTGPVFGAVPDLAFAFSLDLDALASFGGPMPEWLRSSGARLTGEVGIPCRGSGLFDAPPVQQVAARANLTARRLSLAGHELTAMDGLVQLRDGQLRFDTTEQTLLDQGPFTLALRCDLRDAAVLPTSVAVRWRGGHLLGPTTQWLRYAVPLFAGLDAAHADLRGFCDLDAEFDGPARQSGQNWLQLLGAWSGRGNVGLREAALAPAPALAGLLSPLAAFGGVAAALGDGGRLAIDSFEAPFTLRRGSFETKLGRWLAKGRTIGLHGTVHLDGTLAYALDLTALLKGRRDGDRVLQVLGGKLPEAGLGGTLSSPELGLLDVDGVLRGVRQQDLEERGRKLLQRSIEDVLRRRD